jgi:hypothetical protein
MPAPQPPADTDPRAWAIQVQLMREMPGDRKLAAALELSATVRRMMASQIRAVHPDWTDEDVFLAVAERSIGRELVKAAYGKTAPSA